MSSILAGDAIYLVNGMIVKRLLIDSLFFYSNHDTIILIEGAYMNGFSLLMLIFGILVFLSGIYLYTGHKNELLLWKTYDIKKVTKEELKVIGKWTMIASVIPIILCIIGFFIEV